jgi:hypothetical protein
LNIGAFNGDGQLLEFFSSSHTLKLGLRFAFWLEGTVENLQWANIRPPVAEHLLCLMRRYTDVMRARMPSFHAIPPVPNEESLHPWT